MAFYMCLCEIFDIHSRIDFGGAPEPHSPNRLEKMKTYPLIKSKSQHEIIK
jgi:hypothetical protein